MGYGVKMTLELPDALAKRFKGLLRLVESAAVATIHSENGMTPPHLGSTLALL